MSNFQKDYWEREGLEKRRHPSDIVIKEYVIPRIKKIKEIIPIDKKTRILDVGSGNGFFSYYFDKICDTIGVDYSRRMLKLNPIKQKYIMNADNLKFKNNSFDIVFCHALLHHVEDINKVLKEMSRVSKRYVVVIEPNRNNPFIFLFSLIIKEERKALKFSKNYLMERLRENNLKIIKACSYGAIVPNKTPKFLLNVLKIFNFENPIGVTNIIICEKK